MEFNQFLACRPLTLTVPKPLVEFCNEPMIVHQIKVPGDACTALICTLARAALLYYLKSIQRFIHARINALQPSMRSCPRLSAVGSATDCLVPALTPLAPHCRPSRRLV